MRSSPVLLAIAFCVLVSGLAGPAWAGGGVSIPEPTDATLFALAIAGLVIGRYAARGTKRDDT